MFRHYEDWELWLHALACGWRGQRIDAVTFDIGYNPGPVLVNQLIGKDNTLRW